MRSLILSSSLLAAVLLATPQSAFAQRQADQPIGGGGGIQQPNPSEPRTGDRPSTQPSDQSVGGGGDLQRGGTEPGPGGRPSMRPSDQPIGGGGGQQQPSPSDPRR